MIASLTACITEHQCSSGGRYSMRPAAFQTAMALCLPTDSKLIDFYIDVQIKRANDIIIHERFVNDGHTCFGLAALLFL